jgi:hypothetical protein
LLKPKVAPEPATIRQIAIEDSPDFCERFQIAATERAARPRESDLRARDLKGRKVIPATSTRPRHAPIAKALSRAMHRNRLVA